MYVLRVVNNAAPMFPNNFKRALGEFDVNEVGGYGVFSQVSIFCNMKHLRVCRMV